ncbi:hypothetical protein Q3G72_007348 [Acer saccharum]|nr:hypothetical protein Q3G72_007348 [Acer saccharum]
MSRTRALDGYDDPTYAIISTWVLCRRLLVLSPILVGWRHLRWLHKSLSQLELGGRTVPASVMLPLSGSLFGDDWGRPFVRLSWTIIRLLVLVDVA